MDRARVSKAIEREFMAAVRSQVSDTERDMMTWLWRHVNKKKRLTVSQVATIRALPPSTLELPSAGQVAAAMSANSLTMIAKLAAIAEIGYLFDELVSSLDDEQADEEDEAEGDEGDFEGDEGDEGDVAEDDVEDDANGSIMENAAAAQPAKAAQGGDSTDPDTAAPKGPAVPEADTSASASAPVASPTPDTAKASAEELKALSDGADKLFPFIEALHELPYTAAYRGILFAVFPLTYSNDVIVARLAARVTRRFAGLSLSSNDVHGEIIVPIFDRIISLPLNRGGTTFDLTRACRRMISISKRVCEKAFVPPTRAGAGFEPSDFNGDYGIRFLAVIDRALAELDLLDTEACATLEILVDLATTAMVWHDEGSSALTGAWKWNQARAVAYLLASAPVTTRVFSLLNSTSLAGFHHLLGETKDMAFRRAVCGDSDAGEAAVRGRLKALYYTGAILLRDCYYTLTNGGYTLPCEEAVQRSDQWRESDWTDVAPRWRAALDAARANIKRSLSPVGTATVAQAKAVAERVMREDAAFRIAAKRRGCDTADILAGITPATLQPYTEFYLDFAMGITSLTVAIGPLFEEKAFRVQICALVDMYVKIFSVVGGGSDSFSYAVATRGIVPLLQRLLTKRLLEVKSNAFQGVQYCLRECSRVYAAQMFVRGPRSEPFRKGPLHFPATPAQAMGGEVPDLVAFHSLTCSTDAGVLDRGLGMIKDALYFDTHNRCVPGQEMSTALIKGGLIKALANNLDNFLGASSSLTANLVETLKLSLVILKAWSAQGDHAQRAFRSEWLSEYVLTPAMEVMECGIVSEEQRKELDEELQRVITAADVTAFDLF